MKSRRKTTTGIIDFLLLIVIFFSCKDDKYYQHLINNENKIPIKLTINKDTVFARQAKPFSVEVKITGIEYLSKLEIYKKDASGTHLHKTVNSFEIENDTYHFSYEITSEDDKLFYIIFKAYIESGKSTQKTLTVSHIQGFHLTNLTTIARVTGKSLQGEGLPNPNNTHLNYELSATDLGIIWEIEPGKVGIFFGDSYGGNFIPGPHGGPHNVTDWRSNVLAFSQNTDLDKGLKFSAMVVDPVHPKRAKEIIPRWGYKSFTSIPTSAISVNGVQYVHYMNFQVFGGEEELNYSSLYQSKDKGINWTSCKENILFPANSRFGQITYAKRDGYVYMIGTPIGRSKSACLARFEEKNILNQNQYEYWNGYKKQWVKENEDEATVILDGTVGEMSLMFLEKQKLWLILYFDAAEYAICYRTTTALNGNWSEEKVLASGKDYPQLYGSFMHPFGNQGDQIYFTMSLWGLYNVLFMRADILF